MKKIFLSSLIISSFIFAQDKSNEAPLQHEVITKQQNDKTGFILGVELQIGGGVGSLNLFDNNLEAGNKFNSKTFSTVPLITGGYQKYFGEAQKIGLDIRAKFGIGYDYAKEIYKEEYGDTEDVELDRGNISFNSVAYKFGVEANFLYDFLETNTYTLGFNAGIGVGIIYHQTINGEGELVYSEEEFVSGYNHEYTKALKYLFINTSPKIGMHLFYGRHQFNLDFLVDLSFGGKHYYKNNLTNIDTIISSKRYNFYANLGYTYRF